MKEGINFFPDQNEIKITKDHLDLLRIYEVLPSYKIIPEKTLIRCLITQKKEDLKNFSTCLIWLESYFTKFYINNDHEMGLSLEEALKLTSEELLNLQKFAHESHAYTVAEIKNFTPKDIEEIDRIKNAGYHIKKLSEYSGLPIKNLLRDFGEDRLKLFEQSIYLNLQIYLENFRDNNDYPKLSIEEILTLTEQAASNLFNLYVYIRDGYIVKEDAMSYSAEEMIDRRLAYFEPHTPIDIVAEEWENNFRSQRSCFCQIL